MWPCAKFSRCLQYCFFVPFLVRGPRGHHQPALQPFSGGRRWGFVCLASAAVTRSPGDGPQIADFQPFCAISHQVSNTYTAKISQIWSRLKWLRMVRKLMLITLSIFHFTVIFIKKATFVAELSLTYFLGKPAYNCWFWPILTVILTDEIVSRLTRPKTGIGTR